MADVAAKESSISDYIDDYRDLDISYPIMHFKEKDTVKNGNINDTLILLNGSILSKYKNDLDDIRETMSFTTEQESKYFCNPWALSYDLYGSVEYWFLLLEVNNMYSITEFTQSTIQIYDSSLPDVIDAILALEEDFINNNEEDLNSDNMSLNLEEFDDSEDDDDIEDSENDEDDDE